RHRAVQHPVVRAVGLRHAGPDGADRLRGDHRPTLCRSPPGPSRRRRRHTPRGPSRMSTPATPRARNAAVAKAAKAGQGSRNVWIIAAVVAVVVFAGIIAVALSQESDGGGSDQTAEVTVTG